MLPMLHDPFVRRTRALRRLTGPSLLEPFGLGPFDVDPVPLGRMTRLMRDSFTLLDDVFGDNSPCVEMDGGVLRIEVVAPGLDPGTDLEVELAGTELTVRGGHDSEGRGGRRSRRFAYRWDLGREVAEGDVTARYDAGILTVEVTLGDETAPETRKIAIATGSRAADNGEEAEGGNEVGDGSES